MPRKRDQEDIIKALTRDLEALQISAQRISTQLEELKRSGTKESPRVAVGDRVQIHRFPGRGSALGTVTRLTKQRVEVLTDTGTSVLRADKNISKVHQDVGYQSNNNNKSS